MAERGSGGGWWPERPGDGGDDNDSDTPELSPGDGGDRPPHRPPRGLASRDAPKVASRYSTFVGLAFVALVIVAVLNAIGSDGGGTAGSDPDAARGQPISEFAVPEIGGGLEGDANIAQDDCESSNNPCPADQAREPACEIDDPGAIRVCDLFDRPLVISFWFTRGGDCLPTQDAFDEVASRRGDEANFLSINTLDDRADVEEIVRERGWSVAAGHDADGAVATLFGIGGCPTVVLAYPGGVLYRIEAGTLTAPQIDSLVDELLDASEEREPGGGA